MPVMSDFKEEEHRRERHPGRFGDKPVPASDLSIAEDLLGRARVEPPRRILFPSESLATDGGLIAITDVSGAMLDTELESDYRVVGGIAVMLHVLRTGQTFRFAARAMPTMACLLGFSRKETWSGRSSVGGTPRQRGIVGNARSTMSGQRL